MKAKLLVEKHYPAAWVFSFPVMEKGSIVPIVPATNIPQGSPDAIRYWIDTPALKNDAYGVGLYDGEFELIDNNPDPQDRR